MSSPNLLHDASTVVNCLTSAISHVITSMAFGSSSIILEITL